MANAPIRSDNHDQPGEMTPEPGQTAGANTYICSMCAGVEQEGPGACPKCGMALEPAAVAPPETRTEYTCPMHPEIVREAPGDCPICGMALEPTTVVLEEGPNPELVDMTRRFWVSLVLSAPVVWRGKAGAVVRVEE